MKEASKSPLQPVSASVATVEEIDAMRTRLVRAQIEENEAIRRLGQISAQAEANKANLDRLLIEARTARDRANAIYAELAKALESVERSRSARTRPKK